MDKKVIHTKLKDLKTSYGSKYGEQAYNRWQPQAPTFTDILSDPVNTTVGVLVGSGYQPGDPAVQARSPAVTGGGDASGQYSPTHAHAGRGSGYQRCRGSLGRADEV